MENQIKFSILIRTRNEERFIGYAIQSVIDYVKDDFEIIIIDTGSTDETLNIVQDFIPHTDIKILKYNSPYTPGAALNFGVEYAEGEFVLILSAHSELIKFNTIYLPHYIRDKGFVAVGGQQIPVYRGKKISRRYIWSNFGEDEKINPFCQAEDRFFLHNACAFYSRKFLMEHPFPIEYSTKEDRYWIQDLRGKSYNFIYAPSILACRHHWTPNGATWKGIG